LTSARSPFPTVISNRGRNIIAKKKSGSYLSVAGLSALLGDLSEVKISLLIDLLTYDDLSKVNELGLMLFFEIHDYTISCH
jgi:hypothetical protein